jgi:hypothetical protein
VIGALLLAAAVVALGGAARRAASAVAEPGLETLVAAAVLFAAAAVIEALAAGLLALGGSAIVLTLLALASWSLADRLLPVARRRRRSGARTWWRQSDPWERALIGAAGGALVALCATVLHRPEPGFDGITYHLPEVVSFVQGGHTGAEVLTGYALPTGAYPLTNEVLLAWGTALSGGFAALTLWTPACAALLIAAGWLGLRNIGVTDPRVRALALAALTLGPLFVVALPQPGTDLPAVTWLVCCAALCTSARARPLLLAPAILALGLAIGTKTTPATLGVPIVACTVWVCRRQLRAVATPLLAACGAAVLAGGVWYVRNFVVHGSPLWPFYSTSLGDPVPPLIQVASHTLLERPLATLRHHVHTYARAISGSLVLLFAGAVVPLAGLRRKRLGVAAGAVILSALAWANAPVTGLPEIPALVIGAESSVRYLLPVFAAGACALALAASEPGSVVRCAGLAGLIGALVWDLVSDVRNHFWLPLHSWLYAGVVAGAGLSVLGGPWVARRVRTQGLVLCGCVAGVAFVAIGGSGFVSRHALVSGEVDARLEAFFAVHSGPAPIAAAPFAPGLLAGDSLSHRVTLLPRRASCAAVFRAVATGWVVIDHVSDPIAIPGHPGSFVLPPGTAQGCLARTKPTYVTGSWQVFG